MPRVCCCSRRLRWLHSFTLCWGYVLSWFTGSGPETQTHKTQRTCNILPPKTSSEERLACLSMALLLSTKLGRNEASSAFFRLVLQTQAAIVNNLESRSASTLCEDIFENPQRGPSCWHNTWFTLAFSLEDFMSPVRVG